MRAASLVSLLLAASAVAAVQQRHHRHHREPGHGWFEWENEEGGDADPPGLLLPLTRRSDSVTTASGAVNFSALAAEFTRIERKYKWNKEVVQLFEEKQGVQVKRSLVPLRLPVHQPDGAWYAPIQVGTPAKTFNVMLDTGSADLVLADRWCPDSQCGDKVRYATLRSKTSIYPGTLVSINYAGGSTSGKLMYDTVKISTNSALKQPFVSATSMSSSLTDLVQDGLGLAWVALAKTGGPSLPFALYKQGVSDRFTIRLTAKLGYSYFQMGTTQSRVPAKFRTIPISKTPGATAFTYWQVGESMVLNNLKQTLSSRVGMIFDCGTSIIVAPLADATKFWASVSGAKVYSSGIWTYPCASPPSITLALTSHGYRYAMSSDDFNMGHLASDSTRCVGGVFGMNTGLSQWLIGETFFKSWAVVHNMNPAAPWIGFGVPNDIKVPM